jgi:hypothetical protein
VDEQIKLPNDQKKTKSEKLKEGVVTWKIVEQVIRDTNTILLIIVNFLQIDVEVYATIIVTFTKIQIDT